MTNIIDYYKNNPEGYWFKRKLYGWGWMPVKWQGWLVTAISIAIIIGGAYVGEVDDAPGLILLSFVIGVSLLLYFAYKKGEKPKWMWGLPKDTEKSEEDSN